MRVESPLSSRKALGNHVVFLIEKTEALIEPVVASASHGSLRRVNAESRRKEPGMRTAGLVLDSHTD
jgi:hypothetical protein